ncbi:hypothetical protein I3843_03G240000 [Carya illinoinensis]|uniref:probable carbohydrate esterase At4g34215 isoform X1 n=1 Tax=Carya illinoinensis TaxID=32201 RepID=UPI001C71BCFC|nr:probable carbohydrate esterase At4g34215 isoform X1 [Carya illinoinensis]KAG7989475.1 hypothetical protein I3843_03G240000 [Carya illinoinensis]
MEPLFFLVLLVQVWSVRPHDQLLNKNIFILAGQSNMAGRGGVVDETITGAAATWDGIVPPQCKPSRSILRLSANLTWVLAHEPLHADIDVKKTVGVGPGMAFANAVLAKDATFGVIGLVPCAVGGTKIREWGKGTFLYKQLMRRARSSLQDGGTIQALLWYQGESDTVTKEDTEYKRKLERFFMDFRDDLQSPLLPIIQVALASGSGPFIKIVREAQLGIDLLNLRTVDAKGLSLEPDGLHLTTRAQVRLGKMLADSFLHFLPTSPILTPTHTSSTGPPIRCSNFIFYIFLLALLLRCIRMILGN